MCGVRRNGSLAFAFYNSLGTQNTPSRHSLNAFYSPLEVYASVDTHITGIRWLARRGPLNQQLTRGLIKCSCHRCHLLRMKCSQKLVWV